MMKAFDPMHNASAWHKNATFMPSNRELLDPKCNVLGVKIQFSTHPTFQSNLTFTGNKFKQNFTGNV